MIWCFQFGYSVSKISIQYFNLLTNYRQNVIKHTQKNFHVLKTGCKMKRRDGRPCILYLRALNKIVFGLHTIVNVEDTQFWVTVTT